MSLNYHKNNRLNKILMRQDEYQLWYSAMLRHFSMQDLAGIQGYDKPALFLTGLSDTLGGLCSSDDLGRLNQENTELFKTADALASSFDAQNKEERKSLHLAFMSQFDTFLEELNGIRDAVFYKERGFDKFSGLKNKSTMFQDFFLEMERLSRQGTPFAMALAKIDDYERLKARDGGAQAKSYLKLAAQGFMDNLRPFDDAYYTAENEFVLCLKQTNLSGGMRAFQRFEEYLERVHEEKGTKEDTPPLMMSCCIAELVVGDDVSELLDNLREDISKIKREPGAIFSYQEVSPLQRYVNKK